MKKQLTVEKLNEFQGHKGSIFALEIDPEEQYCFSSGDDGMVVKWDLKTNEDHGEGIIRTHCSVYALCYLAQWHYLAAGTSDGTVYIIDLSASRIIHTYRQTTHAIYKLYFAETNNQLWILQANGLLGIISIPDFNLIFHERISNNHLRSAIGSSTGESVFIGNSDAYILEVDAGQMKMKRYWKAHENSVFSLGIHPDGRYLISGSRDAQLNIWDLKQEGQQLIKQIPAHMYTINDIAFSPDQDYLVTASRDKTIKLWDAYHFELLKVIDFARNEGHQHSVNRIKWLKSDNSLISCSDDRRIIRWSLHING